MNKLVHVHKPNGCNMDYTKIYNNLILKCKKRDLKRENGYDFHHIIPKCFGGNDSDDNLVKLTYKEHFVAHLLLYKMQTEKKKIHQMLTAVIMMKGKLGNSRLYSNARHHYIQLHRERISGENHPMYGVSRSGKDNPFYGKTHTEDTILYLSSISKNKVIAKRLDTGEVVKVTKEEFDNDDNLVGHTYGTKSSEETKNKISKNNAKVGKDKVAVLDILDNKFKLVDKEEYYEYRNKRYFGTMSKRAISFRKSKNETINSLFD